MPHTAHIVGKVHRIIGPIVHIKANQDICMLELVEIGEKRLVGEVVRVSGDISVVQVYEDTTGIAPGAPVFSSGTPLSLELGPGLLGTIFDGIQRPLKIIYDTTKSCYIDRGIQASSLDRTKKWAFTAAVQKGDTVQGGTPLGTCPETDLITHTILLPPNLSGTIQSIKKKGLFTIDNPLGVIRTPDGTDHILTMSQRWPVRKGRPFITKLPITTPLITGQRVIDTLFPIGKGGSVIVPGGFGTGKTMTQHAVAKWCDADIIIFIGCGERGNEITDVLKEFPEIVDPMTGKTIMQRTIIIANTSNMPVAAREASIYTGITMGEYYRDMGYNIAILADSTSRWAEALRELSGRMEEMPADEGFPAYLPTRLAEFYERAGYVNTLSEREGSITVIGSVSPPGGDFSEPVTQHSKRFVRCFWALDRDLANARHYPAISWNDSYSEYGPDLTAWWEKNVQDNWSKLRQQIMELLELDTRLSQIAKLIGPDALPENQRIVLETANLFKTAFLQQNSFDAIDMFTVAPKQVKMLEVILIFHVKAQEALKKGVTLIQIKGMKAYNDLLKMKFTISNDDYLKIDTLKQDINKAFDDLIKRYEGFEEKIKTL